MSDSTDTAPAALRVALVGNPNCGKSTLFNALTRARSKIGNYPGTTVEKRQSALAGSQGARLIVDLPGTYSLASRSPEEDIVYGTLAGALGPRPDWIVCVVDVTQMARGLYLVEHLRDLDLPLTVVLSMTDLIDGAFPDDAPEKIAARLGVEVLSFSDRNPQTFEPIKQRLLKSPPPIASPSQATATGFESTCQLIEIQLAKHHLASSIGYQIWWLESLHAENAGLSLPQGLVEAVEAEVEKLDAGDLREFRRKQIADRYRTVDEHLAVIGPSAVKKAVQRQTDQLDRIFLHPLWGSLAFVVAMGIMFQAVFFWAEPFMSLVEGGVALAHDGLAKVIAPGLTRSLLADGLVAGVGNVLIFLPQICLLFLGLAILEESGYLARAAVLVDRLMRRVGLHGKAFVPLLSSFACAVPGVMAARTLTSRRDRIVTIMIAPFMSCSARLPVYVMVVAAVFSGHEPWLGFISIGGVLITAMYFLGLVVALGTAWLLQRTILRSPPTPNLLELPLYRWPRPSSVALSVFTRAKVFVTQTGPVILALSVLLWGALTFPRLDASDLKPAAAGAPAAAGPSAVEYSIGGRVGKAIEPLIEPLGFDWHIGIGLVASFAAREVLVSTLGQVYALDSEIEPDSPSLRDALTAQVDPKTQRPKFSPLVGVSLMVFFALAMQCLSTVAAVKRETNSWRWPLAQLVYMNTLAYLASWLVFQVGTAMGWGT